MSTPQTAALLQSHDGDRSTQLTPDQRLGKWPTSTQSDWHSSQRFKDTKRRHGEATASCTLSSGKRHSRGGPQQAKETGTETSSKAACSPQHCEQVSLLQELTWPAALGSNRPRAVGRQHVHRTASSPVLSSVTQWV